MIVKLFDVYIQTSDKTLRSKIMFQEFSDNDKNQDFLNDFRQKISQQSTTSFQEKKEELNRSKNVLIGAVSGIVLAGIVGWIALAPKYSTPDNTDLPIVRRPQTAIKMQPIEPGGMEIANQDKSIYDIIEKKVEDTTANVESILPPPEAPIAPVIENKPETIENIITEAEKVIETAPVVAVKETVRTQEIIKIPEPIKIANSSAPLAKISSEFDEAAEVAPKTPASNSFNKSATSGMWQLQLMSSPNKTAIDKSQNTMPKKYAPLAAEVLEVEVADLKEKGTYYRLNAGAFATKAEADKLCNDLKALGATCFAKKKK